MRAKIGVFIVLVSITLLFGSQVFAAENLTPAPGDVALLTGLRTDADANAEAIIAVRLGALFLHRQDNDSLVLVTNMAGTADILNASELDLGWAPGWDFTVEARSGAFGGEVRYFDIPEWSKSRGAVPVTESMVAYPGPMTGIISGPHTVSGSYESMLRSVELNFKWFPIDKLSVLAGPRFLKIDEEMGIYRGPNPTLSFNDKITAENSLLGGQIGVEGVFFNIGGFSADGWLKAGYYANMMESAAVDANPFTPTLLASSDDTHKGTFVGDLAVNLNYAVTPRVLFTAGYQLLWIEKAALAPEQVRVHDPRVTGTGSTATDSVLYQGIRAGVIFLFDIYGKAPAPEPTPAPVIEPKLEPMSKN
jgi:hypothetical protein